MDQITEIKQKLDIVDIINPYVSLTKSGRNYKGVCPFHNEKTPSFMVSQELQLFKCFGCGEGGDIFKFIQKIEGVEFPQALAQLAEKAGVKLEQHGLEKEEAGKKILFEINHIATLFYHYILTQHLSGKQALEYAKTKRKISDEIIESFQIGYAPDSWDLLYRTLLKRNYTPENMLKAGVITPRNSGQGYIDKYRDRLMFPLTDISGKVVGFVGRTVSNREPKYLNSPETPIFHKSAFIFCLDKAKTFIKKDGAIFVEGQMDALTAHQFGFNNVVASGGTSLTPTQLQVVSRYTKDLALCFDSDAAGSIAIQRGIELAEKENFNIKVIMIPAPYKDMDELIHTDIDLAKQVINNPIPIYDFYLVNALKRGDKTSGLGKKKIMEELSRKFTESTSKVVLEHYTKKIAEELDLSEELVKDAFKSRVITDIPEPEAQIPAIIGALAKNSPHEYILALLLKAPLDTAQTFLYKLGQKDFTNSQLQEIFTALKDYLLGRKRKFNIEYFEGTLEENLRKAVDDLYLWDLGEVTEDEKKLNQELDATFERIKKEAAKRELKELTDQIKRAELEKNIKLVNELSERAKTVSARLV